MSKECRLNGKRCGPYHHVMELHCFSGPGCSNLTMSLINVSLKFQTLISEIRHYFLLKTREELLHC